MFLFRVKVKKGKGGKLTHTDITIEDLNSRSLGSTPKNHGHQTDTLLMTYWRALGFANSLEPVCDIYNMQLTKLCNYNI